MPIANFKYVTSFKKKNPVLLDLKVDAKKINPQFAGEIIYGYFKIKLEDASQRKSSGQ